MTDLSLTRVTTVKTTATALATLLTAAEAYSSKTKASTVASNKTKTDAAAMAFLDAMQAVTSTPASTPAPTPTPAQVPTPTPTPPAPPVSGVTVKDVVGLNAALKAAKPGQTILLAPGTYSGFNANGLALGGVTLTSADLKSPATLTGFYLTGASGLTFKSLEFTVEGSSDPQPFRFVNCSNITLDGLHGHGKIGADPVDQPSGPSFINSKNCTVKNCEIEAVQNGVSHSGCDTFRADGNNIHNIRVHGIHGGGSNNVTLSNNLIGDFHPQVGDHQDAIIFWTSGQTAATKNLNVFGNLIYRPADAPIANTIQGIALGDEAGVGNEGVTITGNLLVGTMFNGIAVTDGDAVTIDGNQILPFADQPSWIVMRSCGGNSSVTNNQVQQINNVGSTFTDQDNTIIGPPADKGASAIAAWKASHPASYGPQGAN